MTTNTASSSHGPSSLTMFPSARQKSPTFSHAPSLANMASPLPNMQRISVLLKKNTLSRIQRLKHSTDQIFARFKADPSTVVNLSHPAVHEDILAATGGLEVLQEAGLIRGVSGNAASGGASGIRSDTMRLANHEAMPKAKLQSIYTSMDAVSATIRECVPHCVPLEHRSSFSTGLGDTPGYPGYVSRTGSVSTPSSPAAPAPRSLGESAYFTSTTSSSNIQLGLVGDRAVAKSATMQQAALQTQSPISRAPTLSASSVAPGHRRTTAATAIVGDRALFTVPIRSVQVTCGKGASLVGTMGQFTHFEGQLQADSVWIQLLPSKDGLLPHVPLPDADIRNAKTRGGGRETFYVPASMCDLVRGGGGKRLKPLTAVELRRMQDAKLQSITSQEVRLSRQADQQKQQASAEDRVRNLKVERKTYAERPKPFDCAGISGGQLPSKAALAK